MMTPRPDRFTYPAEKARGGRIVLDRPWKMAVFLGGLAGTAALAIALAVAAV